MNRNLLVSIFWVLVVAGAQGQGYWEEVNGPYGGSLYIWPTNSSTVYCSNAFTEQPYRSTNYAESWEHLNVTRIDPNSYKEELSIGYSGTFYKVVFLTQGGNYIQKLYRSLDDGSTWVEINSNLPCNYIVEMKKGILMGVSPFDDKIYRSINGGASWQHQYTLSSSSISNFGFVSSVNGICIILSGIDIWSNIDVSINNGVNWVSRSLPQGSSSFSILQSGTIISFSSDKIHRSTDYCVSWNSTPLGFQTDEKPRGVVELNNGRLLLASNLRLYSSDDDGISWQPMPDFPEQPDALGLLMTNGNILGVRKGSIFRSSDEGISWAFASDGINKASTSELIFLTDSAQIAVTRNGLWTTNDVGETWTRILADTSKTMIYCPRPLAVLSADSFAVSMANHIWATGNGGSSFVKVTPADGLANVTKNVFPAYGRILFCSSQSGVQRSDDFGNTWNTILPNVVMRELVQHPTAGLFAYIAAQVSPPSSSTLWRSIDEGVTWTQITNLGFSLSSTSNPTVDTFGNLYVNGYYNSKQTLAISGNAGGTWQYKTIPEKNAGQPLISNDLGIVYTTAGDESQIYTSADGGNSWYYLPSYAEEGYSLNDLKISPLGYLYVVPTMGPIYRSTASTEHGAFITGHVRRDADAECNTPDAQQPLHNWNVTLDGENTFYNTTGTDGRYTFFVDTGAYTVQVTTPQNLWWGLCDSIQTVQSDSLFATDTVDFAALALAECPLMSVSVGVPRLRRCFDNNAYVQYCNQGSETADSARVDVILDEFLEFVSADLPHEALGNNTFRFQLGNIASGACGQFGLVVHVNCDSTVLGQTHCIAAHAYPDTLCTPTPDWSGATVIAEAECQDTVVALRLRNIGPTQSQLLPYIIIEDDVVLFQGQDNHPPGGILTLERPANGHTWRIESQQEPGHPFSSVAVAFLEGCGGYESLGFVNQFGVNTFEYSWDRVCLENIGSYDPNDKQGFPLGFGENHRIRPGQELDYLIRFQNTGTDTAFNIVIRDTLSLRLDPASVRPGAASHPYTWSLSGEGALQFTFANILLPDSTTDLAGSQGFVRFRISQRPDLPIGAFIFNQAAIYFDFNDPIITNRTMHMVGMDYLSSTPEAPGFGREGRVAVSPNPVHNEAFFRRKDGQMFDGHRITVTNALGRVVWEQKVLGEQGRFTRRGLPNGLYFFRVEDATGRLVDSGRLIVGL